MILLQIEKVYERIWEGYKLYAKTAFVARKGFELTGMTIVTETLPVIPNTFENRGESVMEHQAKTAWLTSAFLANIPEYFGDKGSFHDATLMTVLLCHDVGETLIGDIPDDGNEEHGTKDEAELTVFRLLAKAFGHHDEQDMIDGFMYFQGKRIYIGKALYALDKIEAVLTQIFMESYGLIGCIDDKPYVTSSDQYFMKVTGSNIATDCWAAHVKQLIYDFPNTIKEPIFELTRVAITDVRGGQFDWWDKYIPTKK